MLPDQVTELLAAFVDGELSQRQRKTALRLLQRSSEARELLRQLQENAHKIKQLPRRKVEPSLVDEILRAIAEQKVQPKQPSLKSARRRHWMPYVAASLAASLLIAAIGVAYWKSMGEWDTKGGNVNVIVKDNGKQDPTPAPTPEPEEPVTPPKKVMNPLLAQITEGTFKDFGQPVVADRIFTARFNELHKEAVIGQLAYQLNKDRTAQLDITVKDNAVAVERLKAALHEAGITVVVDPNAKSALTGKKQAKVEYWVYAENMTTAELAKMMKDLSQADTTGMGKSVPTPYEKMTVTPLAETDKRKLSGKLGVEASKLEMPKDAGNAKPETPKRWERQAVVLPTGTPAQSSKEVRQFVNQRRQPQAGTLQVLIKIHQE
jgi:hypothetical protein